jgi:bidirectional [NiFe] hydrogenase diaphorase subunit
MPEVIIDGKTVTVKPETTILEASQKVGIWIPALCHSPAVSNQATCRLCMVEIDRGDGRKRMVTACNYPVRSNLTVSVNGKRAVKVRKGVMQLLLARCPESPELKEIALRMDVKDTPFPTVTESQRSCILCGLCVAVCEEVIGVSAIGFAGRGLKRVVAAPFRQASEDCIACGACAAVCPVGTIQVRIHKDTGEAEISPFKSRKKLRICNECGSRMVSEPVAVKAQDLVKMNWQEFREKAKLCPECRRKLAARSLAAVALKSN